MAKVTLRLTDTQLRNAKPKEKEYNLSDGQGLQCRIKPSGKKIFLFNYKRPIDGKRTNLTLGHYPHFSLATARKIRDEHLSSLANGVDPAQEQVSLMQKPTLYQAAKQWFEIKQHDVTEDYASDIWRSLELHIFPYLQTSPIEDINPQDVIQALTPLAEKGSLESVKRVCQRLNEIMVFSVNTGNISYNKLAGIRHAFKAPKATHMATLKPNELGQFLVNLMNTNIRRVTRLLILFQLHTMVRPAEASGAQWSEIDLEHGVWIIPAERMKKNREHIVPLTPQVIKILNDARLLNDGSDFVFPADRKRGQPSNPQTANMAIKRMGYGGKLVAHGLRALASTTLNEQGHDPDIIEAALAHEDKNTVRRAYNRAQYLDRRHEMMLWWSSHIDKAIATTLVND